MRTAGSAWLRSYFAEATDKRTNYPMFFRISDGMHDFSLRVRVVADAIVQLRCPSLS